MLVTLSDEDQDEEGEGGDEGRRRGGGGGGGELREVRSEFCCGSAASLEGWKVAIRRYELN
eukprot:SAG22_NODE_1147_length_5370_cov_3.083855_6_plen_61_part_00